MRHALLGLLLPLSALADPVLIDRIAATVDLHVIARSAVEARARPALAHARTPEEQQAVRRDALKQLIDEHLVAEETTRLGITVSDAELDAALAEVGKANGLSVAQVLDEARRQGFPADAYRALLRAQMLEMKWLVLSMARTGQPDGDAERAAWRAKERERLLQALRTKVAIEVRP